MAPEVTPLLESLSAPVVQGPMAGGPSTVGLAAAVCNAGGLGFIAAGYRSPDQLAGDIQELRAQTARPFGINLFAVTPAPFDADALTAYISRLRPEAEAMGVELGTPHNDDDGFAAKLEVVLAMRPAAVSFAFGCPTASVFRALRAAGIEAWVTVTSADEAAGAGASGAQVLVVSGVEAGGHRSSFVDAAGGGDASLLVTLARVQREVDLPLVAAGGIATPESLAAVLAAGAAAAQAGTAFLDTPEAGTSQPHREMLRLGAAPTALTRAFTGRRARGIVNRFMSEYGAYAPSAYPQVHHVTAPLRAAARAAGRPDLVNLWAGQAYPLIDHGVPAADVVRRLSKEV